MPVRRNIYIMYAVSLLQGMVFYASIATLYRQQAGLGVFEITLIESVSLVLSVALELPWGILSDRIGYRKSMIAVNAAFFVSKLVFWQADGFGMFLLERILLAVTISGLSGLDESILYCSCEPDRAQSVFGNYANLGTAGVLFAAGVYSLFIGENYRMAALLTAVSHGAAFLLTLGLKEVHPPQRREASTAASFMNALRCMFSNKKLLLLVISAALLSEAHQTITVFLNQLQYVKCGLNESAIGAIYIGVTLLSLLGGFSAKLTKRFGATGFGTVLYLLAGIACLILGFTGSAALSVVCIAALRLSSSLLGPMWSDLKNRSIMIADRATALSANAVLADGIAVGTNLIFGRLSDASLPAAMLFGAVLCAAGLVLFMKSQKR